MSKEKDCREETTELRKTIGEDIIKLISDDELLIITTKMDRRDYRKHGNYPRFIDLERICKEVIKIKSKYPDWKLKNLNSHEIFTFQKKLW